MRELFIDCSRGLAGDMLSAALLELCPDRDEMLRKLNEIGIPDVRYEASGVMSYSVSGTHMSVTYKGQEEEPGCQGAHHEHHHRHLFDIQQIVEKLNLSESVKTHVLAIYELIAQAEATVHGEPIEHIHFHELGTMDAVADISAVCMMIEQLGVEHITATPICTGFGSIQCAHGILPVPAPATALLLEGIPSFAGDLEGELCTPTGTALVKHLADTFGKQPLMTVSAIGYGIGKKDFGRLSCVRASLGWV